MNSPATSEVQSDIQVGDRVVAVQPTICCNQCSPCKEGYSNCCNSLGFMGLTGWDGGMSDYVAVDAKFAFKLPDNVPSDIGAMVEPLAVAWHAVDQTCIKPGDSALVMGGGPVGLAIVQCLKARQAKEIIVVEIMQERKKFASRFGATAVIDPQEKMLSPSAKSYAMVRDLMSRLILLQFNNLMFGGKRFCTSQSYSTRNVIEALGNELLDVKEMITQNTTMDRVIEDGFSALMHEKDKQMKILVDVRA